MYSTKALKAVSTKEQEDSDTIDSFMNTITVSIYVPSLQELNHVISLNTSPVNFQIDTRADLTETL